MIKLSDVVGAWTQPAENVGPEPFTWSTPNRHDPFLIAQLQRANLELRTLFAVVAQACRDAQFESAADALARCVQKLREVQRVEALRLYPVLAHRASGDSNSSATVAYLRLRAHTLARRFLRLSEELIAACRAHTPRPEDIEEAEAALDSYISSKELQLYQAYTLTAPGKTRVA